MTSAQRKYESKPPPFLVYVEITISVSYENLDDNAHVFNDFEAVNVTRLNTASRCIYIRGVNNSLTYVGV